MFVSVSTNEVWIVQNTWITRTYEHRSMRLQLRGGINILLHGEEVKGKITDELYVYDLEVKNIECKSGVPMLAKLAYQISPDFSNFQALTRLDEDEKQGIGKAKKVFDAAIVNLISIVFSEKEQNEIKKKRVEINNDIKDLIFNQGLLRDQEDHTGCKIVSLMISDTDDTEEIRKSNEQLYVSRGQGEAVKKLMETMGVSIDDKRMSTAEKNAIIERMHAAVMANSGKSQRKDNHIHVGGTSLDRTTMGRIIGETVESSK